MKIKDINICLRLAEERKRLKLTQKNIATICDVSVKTVGRWEKNIPIPADKLALLVPHGYNTTYLLTNVKFEPPYSGQSKNAHSKPNQNLPEISTALSQEQRIWLNIIENMTGDDPTQIKEIGLAILGHSQTRGSS